MIDLILESIRAAILLVLFVYLVRTGINRKELCQQGWRLIILGFGLLFFASLMDITDNFESLSQFIFFGDTSMQAFLEKTVGFSGGFLFLTIGLIKWIPTITDFEDARHFNNELTEQIRGRNRAEHALLKSKEKHRLFFENAPIGIIHYDNEGIITDVNGTMITIFGSSYEKLVGLDVNDIPDKNFSKEVYKSLDGKPGYFEGEYISYTGKKVAYIKADWIPIKKEDKIIAGVGIVEDITHRKQTEEDTKKSEKKLQNIMESMTDGLTICDIDGRITFMNTSGLKQIGYTLKEVLGETPTELFIEKTDLPKFVEDLKTVFSGKILTGQHYQAKRKNGELFPASVNLSALYDNQGSVISLIAIHRDITRQKHAEHEKRHAQKIAAEKEKYALVGQIAGKMAHDFNNVLAVIMGNAQLALLKSKEAKTIKALELIFNQTIRGKNLTKNLVVFAKD
ncbi:PAS domain S-box protein, partial [bacterium]|nr:PAS domain S-box protein [bacterium]